MQQIGGNTYSLVGLDTNVMSEVIRDTPDARAGFFSLFSAGYVPCFSGPSLFELRRRPEIYDQFIDFFDVCPCAMLKGEEQLFDDELAAYPDPTAIDPIIMGFSHINTSRGTNLRNLMDVCFQDPTTLGREQAWSTGLQDELLGDWLELKPNFTPKGRRFLPTDGLRFVKTVTQQQVAFRAPEWTEAQRVSGRAIQHVAFPSLRMTQWTVYFRLYATDRRTPERQDVFDTLISTPAPYLDAVVTENFQAHIYEQVKKLDPALQHLKVFTLKGLRAAGRDV